MAKRCRWPEDGPIAMVVNCPPRKFRLFIAPEATISELAQAVVKKYQELYPIDCRGYDNSLEVFYIRHPTWGDLSSNDVVMYCLLEEVNSITVLTNRNSKDGFLINDISNHYLTNEIISIENSKSCEEPIEPAALSLPRANEFGSAQRTVKRRRLEDKSSGVRIGGSLALLAIGRIDGDIDEVVGEERVKELEREKELEKENEKENEKKKEKEKKKKKEKEKEKKKENENENEKEKEKKKEKEKREKEEREREEREKEKEKENDADENVQSDNEKEAEIKKGEIEQEKEKKAEVKKKAAEKRKEKLKLDKKEEKRLAKEEKLREKERKKQEQMARKEEKQRLRAEKVQKNREKNEARRVKLLKEKEKEKEKEEKEGEGEGEVLVADTVNDDALSVMPMRKTAEPQKILDILKKHQSKVDQEEMEVDDHLSQINTSMPSTPMKSNPFANKRAESSSSDESEKESKVPDLKPTGPYIPTPVSREILHGDSSESDSDYEAPPPPRAPPVIHSANDESIIKQVEEVNENVVNIDRESASEREDEGEGEREETESEQEYLPGEGGSVKVVSSTPSKANKRSNDKGAINESANKRDVVQSTSDEEETRIDDDHVIPSAQPMKRDVVVDESDESREDDMDFTQLLSSTSKVNSEESEEDGEGEETDVANLTQEILSQRMANKGAAKASDFPAKEESSDDEPMISQSVLMESSDSDSDEDGKGINLANVMKRYSKLAPASSTGNRKKTTPAPRKLPNKPALKSPKTVATNKTGPATRKRSVPAKPKLDLGMLTVDVTEKPKRGKR